MGKRSLGIWGVVAFLLLLGGASSASAATYCVGTSGCDHAHTKSTVAAALVAASGDGQNDTVQIGAGTFETNNAVYSGSHTVTLEGNGQGSTVLHDAAANGQPLSCNGAASAVLSVRSLTVLLGGGAQAGIAASTCPVHVHEVEVNSEFAPNAVGIYAGAGTSQVTNATLLAAETSGSAAVAASGATLQISDSTLLGESGLVGGRSATVQAHRLSITATGDHGYGVLSLSATVSIDDSLLHLSSGAVGLFAQDLPGRGATLAARQLSLIGDGSTEGARADEANGDHVSVTVLDSIFRSPDGSSSGFVQSLLCNVNPGGTATISTDYDDLTAPPPSACAGPGASLILGAHNVDVNPQFVGGSGDAAFELSPASPVRALDASPLAAGESSFDLFGRARIRGGKRDLGAFEYQPPAPVARTLGADHIGYTTATLHGTVNPEGTLTGWYFDYGARNVYLSAGHRTPTLSAGSGSAAVPVSVAVHGLRPGHTYHYAAIASSGVLGYGVDRTFRTKQACVVPGLGGKTLTGARRALTRAHCHLGHVSHRHGRVGRVLSQSPQASPHYYAAGHRVDIVLGR